MPWAQTVTDAFTRADSAVSLGSAATGQAYNAAAGTWGISTNRGYLVTPAGTAPSFAGFDLGVIDHAIEVENGDGATASNFFGIAVRYADGTHHIAAYQSATFAVILTSYRDGGALTQFGNSGAALQWTAGRKVRLEAEGDTFRTYVDGTLKRTDTRSGMVGTSIGLWYGSTAALANGKWDNLKIDVARPSAVHVEARRRLPTMRASLL